MSMKRFAFALLAPPVSAQIPTVPVDQTVNQVMTPAAATEALRLAQAGGTGRYKAEMRPEASIPTHTIFAPRDLARAGRLPVLLWGNGACANQANRYRWFLTEIASHGYMVVAVGPIGPAFMETQASRLPPGTPEPPPTPGPRKQETKAAQLIDGLNWALAENARKGSRYFGRLNPAKVGVMGTSCGGLQTIQVSADKRITTAIVWNSGTFPDGTPPLDGAEATKDSLKLLHAPTAWISGDARDVAHKNANADFERISGIPAMRAWATGIGHGGTYREPSGGEFARIGTAWFDWQLKGDAKGKAWFVGTNCGLCRDPRWTVKWKGL
jgi:dienelactone hydrolase